MALWIPLLSLACTVAKETDSDESQNSNIDDSGEENLSTYGPENSWFHGSESDVPTSEECGFSVGDQACNFTMVDQYGDEVELYQFAGKYIVLDLFAEW